MAGPHVTFGDADLEHTVPIDLGIKWSAGAPSPTVLADEHDAYLVFDLGETETGGERTGIVTWRGVLALTFGFPNDETQSGHRLWRGKSEPPPYYGAVEVLGSAWIA